MAVCPRDEGTPLLFQNDMTHNSMKRTLTLLALAVLTACAMAQEQQQLAFPGAEGFGRYTTGGRGGKVYHVTTLEDDGTTSLKGSLRWACAQSGPRTIVFDVSGTIFLKSALKLNENTTLAGQTAPGDGICIAGYQVTLRANNIIRYLRFRPGDENGGEPDGLGAMDSRNIIVDHCSVSWSVDECLSVYGSRNITVQWCIAAQSLCNSTHVKKAHGYGGNWGGSGASYHHNLIIHHVSRTPRLGPRPGTQTDERMDMRNNVMYNWIDNGVYGGEGMNVNIVNNYYKPGPDTKTGAKGMRIAAPGIRTTSYCIDKVTESGDTVWNDWHKMWHVWGKYYVAGNVNTKYPQVTEDNWKYGIYNQVTNGSGVDYTYTQETKDTMRIDTPISYEAVTTHTAEQAFEQVLRFAGASLHRDALDEVMVSDARNGETTYTASGNQRGIINHPSDLRPDDAPDDWSPWPTLKQGEAPVDTDGDGMPDDWETAHGLDPNNAADGNETTADGYTQLEHYLNSLVADITEQQNEGGELWSGQQTTAIQPVSPDRMQPAADGAYYTLQGVRVSQPAKGLYIHNRKKTIIR